MASDIQIRQKQMEKAYRSQVRLRYSLLADEEIDRNIEAVRETIGTALALGQRVQLTPAEITIDGASVEAITSGPADS